MTPNGRPLSLTRRAVLGEGAALAITLAGAGSAAGAEAGSPAALGDVVRWPVVHLMDGRTLEPDSWRNTAAVVVFFATTCPYCQRHNEHVEKLVRASRGQALRVLGVAGDREPAPVQRYLRDRGYSFEVTLDDGPLRSVLTTRRVIPLTGVIDRAGRLRELIPGEMFEDDVLGLARWATGA